MVLKGPAGIRRGSRGEPNREAEAEQQSDWQKIAWRQGAEFRGPRPRTAVPGRHVAGPGPGSFLFQVCCMHSVKLSR